MLAELSEAPHGRATAKPVEASDAASNRGLESQSKSSVAKAFDLDLSHSGVLTGEMLASVAPGASIRVSKSVVLTPSARDAVRMQSLVLVDAGQNGTQSTANAQSSVRAQLLVVTSTPETRSLADAMKKSGWEIDYLGCDGEAVKAARSAVCRGESNFVAIVAPKPHRTAQRLNRTRNVLAAAVLPEINVNDLIAEGEWNIACLSAERWASFRLRKTLDQLAKGAAG